MKKIAIQLVLNTLLLFVCTYNITVSGEGLEFYNGGESSGTNSICSSTNGFTACYTSRYQFRATLVGADGKKVDGTTSVDFGNDSYAGRNINVLTLKNGKFSGKYNLSANPLINDKVFKYKYGTNTDTDETPFQYIEMKLDTNKYKLANGRDNPAYYGTFMNEFTNKLINQIDDYNLNGEKVDFFSVFAYYSGYSKKFENKGAMLEDVSVNNYFLLLEPTFRIEYNVPACHNCTWAKGFYYKYGTGMEMLEWMASSINQNLNSYYAGYLRGLSINFVYQATCNGYTPNNNKAEFNVVTDDPICGSSSGFYKNYAVPNVYPQVSDRLNKMNDIVNNSKTNGDGVYAINLRKEMLKKIPNYASPEVNLCQDDSMSFSPGNLEYDQIKNEDFLVSGANGADSAIYCYDTVSYDFSGINAIIDNNITSKIIAPITIYNPEENINNPEKKINPLILNITRKCYFLGLSGEESSVEDFDMYPDKKIKLNVFNKEYILEKKDITTTKNNDRNIKHGKAADGWITWTATIMYDLNEAITIKPIDNIGNDGYISFGDDYESLFGKDLYINTGNNVVTKLLKNSNNSLDEIAKQQTINNTEYTIQTVTGTNAVVNEKKCTFKYNTQGTEPTLPDEILLFRTIDLNNPFPARDGTSRLPGTNWLNTENYVYNYITNNRAIQYHKDSYKNNITGSSVNLNYFSVNPEMMYILTEPMYTITLDPSTMMKIRNYNNSNDYNLINDNLDCNSENRECISNFLRDQNIIKSENFSGVCSYSSTKSNAGFHVVTEDKPNFTEEEFRKFVYNEASFSYEMSTFYSKFYDLDKNKRNDYEDLEILKNWDKNTFFYTCADKTYKSGG